MAKADFVENRIDVVKNIYTLYSYLKDGSEEKKEWAQERFENATRFIVESFGNKLFFAPCKFVGFKNNTYEKHSVSYGSGDGIEVLNNLTDLKLYKNYKDDFLTQQFYSFIKELGMEIEKNEINFSIPNNLSVEDLKAENKCYFISPTHCNGQKQKAWNSFVENNLMAIGWNDEDYSNSTTAELESIYKNQDESAVYPFKLIKQIRNGDIICCTNNNHGLYGIGIALSSYKYKSQIHFAGTNKDGNECYYSHYIDVAWLCSKEEGYIPTKDFNIKNPERQWVPYGTLNEKEIPLYIENYLFRNKPKQIDIKSQYKPYIKILKENRNIVLTGAPGTGKTYLARRIAEAMGAEYEMVQFHPSYDYSDFVEGLRPVKDENGNIAFERKDGIFKSFCKEALKNLIESRKSIEEQHKELTINETINGFLSNAREENTVFKTVNGSEFVVSDFADTIISVYVEKNPIRKTVILNRADLYDLLLNNVKVTAVYDIRKYFKRKYATQADSYTYILYNYLAKQKKSKNDVDKNINEDIKKVERKNYVFIIDEINRGEISKIFGELFFSIDPGYRKEEDRIKVKTQYQELVEQGDVFRDGFFVPENVYIIGTMNDIDRSVESMDFAMRRRFTWIEVAAEESANNMNIQGEARERMFALNDAILKTEGLGREFQIGGALFLNQTDMEELWDYHLSSLLKEYLRGMPDAEANFKKLEEAFRGVDSFEE